MQNHHNLLMNVLPMTMMQAVYTYALSIRKPRVNAVKWQAVIRTVSSVLSCFAKHEDLGAFPKG